MSDALTSMYRRRLGDVPDAAAITKLSAKTVRRMIDAGKFPGVCRIGQKLIRIDLDVLDKWIDQGCPALSRFNVKGGQQA